MQKIAAKSRARIKQLFYHGYILGIKGDQYKGFGGFQQWIYNKEQDICRSCESNWIDGGKKVKAYSLDKAAKILWHQRNNLFLYTRGVPEQKLAKIKTVFKNTNNRKI